MGLKGNGGRQPLRRVPFSRGQLLGVMADDVVDDPAPAPAFAAGECGQNGQHVRIEHHPRRPFVRSRHAAIVSDSAPTCQVGGVDNPGGTSVVRRPRQQEA